MAVKQDDFFVRRDVRELIKRCPTLADFDKALPDSPSLSVYEISNAMRIGRKMIEAWIANNLVEWYNFGAGDLKGRYYVNRISLLQFIARRMYNLPEGEAK